MKTTDFSINTVMTDVCVDMFISEQTPNYTILKFSVSFKEKHIPSPIKVLWKFPAKDELSAWSPLIGFSRFIEPNWRRAQCESKTAAGAPVLSLVDHSGNNACTIAVSDPKTPIQISAGISEEEAVFFCKTTFFTSYVSPIEHYEAYIRIDFQNDSFVDAVKRVNAWWENNFGLKKAYVPKEAYLPMDSSWYSFHQDLIPEKIIEECKLSAQLGMKTIIIDDGWQTADNNRGYCYCGDWQFAEQKIPDMKSLVKKIHGLGMKVMLWFSVPYVGPYSKIYEKFKDMALTTEKGVIVVDIRYKEVREYLVNTYVKAVMDYGLDGLKLDFIDHFNLTEDSPAVNDRMDIPSVEDALEELLARTKKELLAINPEILLEFRQKYVGPTVLKYGNMVRVGDCPYDSMRNRMSIIDLRLTSGKTAVHSDMIMWSKDAPVETAARQLISTLFGVPQVSVLLKDMPQQHVETIKFWLDFYTQNIEILHSDELYVKNPELGYTQVKSSKDGLVIGVNYASVPFEIKSFKCDSSKYTVINSSETEQLFVYTTDNVGQVRIKIFDCLGKKVSEHTQNMCNETVMLNVPVCGFVEISR